MKQITSEEWAHPSKLSPQSTFDLGQHTLELLDERAILLLDHASQSNHEVMQLDGEETYRLLIVLQEVFRRSADCRRSQEEEGA